MNRWLWFFIFIIILVLCSEIFCASVTGKIRYTDKNFYLLGFTGTELKPARYIHLEIRRVDNNNVLGDGTTDNQGNFSIMISNSGNLDIYVLAIAQSDTSPYTDVVVRNNEYQGSIQSVASTPEYKNTNSLITFDFDIPVDNVSVRIGDPFNIIDCILLSAQKVYNEISSQIPLVTIYWEDGSGDGSYYQDSKIYLLGGTSGSPGSGDNDGYDDSVIIHEYGHFISKHYSVDKSPGGDHSSTEYYNPQLTWSEGWATFLNLAVRNSCVYWDSSGSGGVSVDFETPAPDAELRIGMNNESAVACVLYDIFDGNSAEDDTPGSDDDFFAMGFDEIWDVVDSFMDNVDLTATFDDFYNGWRETFPAINVDSVFVGRQIEFVPWNSSEKVYERKYLYTDIPDWNATGIVDKVNVNSTDLVRYVKIFVDIDHSKLSDLEVSLTSPDATNVLLHNHTGGSNIINWYGYDNYEPPSVKLDTFVDKNPLGDWELNVIDINAGDAGKLISYKLKIGFKTTFSENWFVY